MKNFILEFSEFMTYKLALGFYILLNGLTAWLLTWNLYVDFAYIGLAGQIVSLLIGIRNSLQPANAKVAISLRLVIISIIELIVGPIIAMVSMSYFYGGTVSATSALYAFLIGAFWELIWNFFKKYVLKRTKNIIDDNDSDNDIPKTTSDGGEPVKGGGQ